MSCFILFVLFFILQFHFLLFFILFHFILIMQVHEELVKQLTSLLRPQNSDFLVIGKFLKYSWFFFELITKSISQYLISTKRIKVRPRRGHCLCVKSITTSIKYSIQRRIYVAKSTLILGVPRPNIS